MYELESFRQAWWLCWYLWCALRMSPTSRMNNKGHYNMFKRLLRKCPACKSSQSLRQLLSLWVQIKRKLKRQRKQQRNVWSNLRWGASRPPRRFPRLRFCFRLRFNLRLIWINIECNWRWRWRRLRRRRTKKIEKKTTLAQTIDQVMTIKTHTESSKTELSSRGKRPFKVWLFAEPITN